MLIFVAILLIKFWKKTPLSLTAFAWLAKDIDVQTIYVLHQQWSLPGVFIYLISPSFLLPQQKLW